MFCGACELNHLSVSIPTFTCRLSSQLWVFILGYSRWLPHHLSFRIHFLGTGAHNVVLIRPKTRSRSGHISLIQPEHCTFRQYIFHSIKVCLLRKSAEAVTVGFLVIKSRITKVILPVGVSGHDFDTFLKRLYYEKRHDWKHGSDMTEMK